MSTPIANQWLTAALYQEQAAGFWRLNESTGLIIYDASSLAGNNGTASGTGLTYSVSGWAGDGGLSITFDGANGFISMGNVVSFAYTSRFTVRLSVKIASTVSSEVLVGKVLGASGKGWVVSLASHKARFAAYDSSGSAVFDFSGSVTIDDGNWHSVTCTYDRFATNKARIYVDGVLDNSATPGATAPDTNSASFILGKQDTGNFFSGTMCEVGVYPYVFTAAQVTRQQNARNTLTNTKALMVARSGIMRSGASRSDYFYALLVALMNGVSIASRIEKGTLKSKSILSDQPDTAQFTMWTKSLTPSNLVPSYADSLILADGAANNQFFGGTIVKVRRRPDATPGGLVTTVYQYDVWATDWTWLLNRYTVTKYYASGQSGTTVINDLISNYGHGLFTTTHVQAGAPTLTAPLTFKGLKLRAAIQQVCQATAPNWKFYVDPTADCHYYLTETTQNPAPIVPGTYNYNSLDYTLDLNQVRTRELVEGGGVQVTAPVAIGATSIPVQDCSIYSASGGTVVTPSTILVTYTGRSASSGPGNLTGVPASGAGSVTVALAQGDPLNVWVQVDDVAAQTALGALELDQNGNPTSGIHEQYLNVANGTIDQCTQAALGELAAYKTAAITGKVWSLDRQMRAGKTLSISLSAALGINVNVTIQQVERSFYTPGTWQFMVTFGATWSNIVDVFRRLNATQ